MSFLSRLFGGGAKRYLKVLDESINLLRFGVFTYLFKNKYLPIFGKEDASLWAGAVLNTMILSTPGNEQANVFLTMNKEKVLQEALNVNKDEELSGLTGAASYLYAAEILYSTAMIKNPYSDSTTMNPFSERIQGLEERAARLGIWIPDSHSICGSNDVRECIYRIESFAKEFLNKHAIGAA